VSGGARALPRLAGAAAWDLVGWLPLALLALAWEGLARSGLVTRFMLPPLSAVLERMGRDGLSGELVREAALTLGRTLAGFGIAAAAGVALGIAVARRPAARWFFDPIISVGFPMPKIAFLPIVTLWLGFHDASKIAMAALDAVFPVAVATAAGAAAVERELVWSARNLGASELELTWEVIVPAALPQILTGLQVALPIALIVCIVAEMASGGTGLGGAMLSASRFADSPGVFAGIVEIALVGWCLVRGMAALRRRLLRWHQESSGPSIA
jgi:ABC-type nitrate/sulfonate/bicarbonate transport system permease component